MSNQEPITTEGKTLKEAAEAYLESLAAGGTKSSTDYVSYCTSMVRWWII